MSLQERFGARVTAIRMMRGLTQQQLADRLSRSVNSISALERGVSLPSFQTIERLAGALKVPVRDLFDEDGEKNDPEREKQLASLRASARQLQPSGLALAVEIVNSIVRHQEGH